MFSLSLGSATQVLKEWNMTGKKKVRTCSLESRHLNHLSAVCTWIVLLWVSTWPFPSQVTSFTPVDSTWKLMCVLFLIPFFCHCLTKPIVLRKFLRQQKFAQNFHEFPCTWLWDPGQAHDKSQNSPCTKTHFIWNCILDSHSHLECSIYWLYFEFVQFALSDVSVLVIFLNLEQ